MKKIFFITITISFFILSFFSILPIKVLATEPAYEYFKSGIAFYDQGNYEQAIVFFQKACRADPNFAESYYNLGITYDLQGKFKEAILAYEQVIQIDPNQGTALANLAEDCYVVGDLRKGMDYIKLAESLGKPIDKALYNEMWEKARDKNKDEKGRKEGRKDSQEELVKKRDFSTSEPESKPWQKVQHDLELTIVSLEKELIGQAGQSEESKNLINLGIKYRQKGEFGKSIDIFSKVVNLNINKAITYAELSLCYYLNNNKKSFVQYFKKAKEIGFKPSKSLNDLYLKCSAQK